MVLKTVAGFLNSRHGGTLLIGVANDGSLVGLGHDFETLRKPDKDDADRFQLHLTNLLIESVGEAAASNVTLQIQNRAEGRNTDGYIYHTYDRAGTFNANVEVAYQVEWNAGDGWSTIPAPILGQADPDVEITVVNLDPVHVK